MKYIFWLIFSQKSPQTSTTRNCIHFLFLGHGNVQNVPKSCISGHFGQFSGPLTHSKALYTTSKQHLGAYILSKVSINWYYQKIYSFLILWHGNAQNVPKSRISEHFDLFSDPLTHKMAPYTNKKVHSGAHILLQAYTN